MARAPIYLGAPKSARAFLCSAFKFEENICISPNSPIFNRSYVNALDSREHQKCSRRPHKFPTYSLLCKIRQTLYVMSVFIFVPLAEDMRSN